MRDNDDRSCSRGGVPASGVATGVQPPLTLPLEQATEGQQWLVGGKAVNLGVLMRAKLPVPPGFCVTGAAFTQFLESSPKRAELLRLLTQLSTDHSPQVQELSAQAVACLAGVPIPPAVEEAILAAWRAMGEERSYAVRSSATVEDTVDHSFAGQFESVLNVQGREALLAAVTQCWRSLFSPRALAYHAKEQLPVERTVLAVVIQEMVPAEAAGVLFTVDPVSGDTGRMVIEAAAGLGDRLVSGSVDAECVVLEKAGLNIVERRGSSGRPCLDDPRSRQLAELASQAERLFGRPLDIEWAAAGGRVFLLQARPVTAAAKPKSWEERQRWSNVNTGEIFPDVATPMTWSVIQLLMVPLFRSLFRLGGADADRAPVAGLVAGRIYFNVNTGLAVLKPFGFLVGGLAHVAQAVGGGLGSEYVRGLLEVPAADVPDVGFRWPNYVLAWPRIFYDLIAHAPRRGDAWILRLKARTDELVRQEVESLSTSDLATFPARLLRDRFEDWDLLYLVTQAAALPLFQKACRDWLDDPHLTLGYRLFAGLGGVPEAEAGLALWRLAALAHADAALEAMVRAEEDWAEVQTKLASAAGGGPFLRAWSAFMSEHGHHCRGELELFNARWSETPDYILGLVRGYLRSIGQTDPQEHHRRVAAERRALTAECRQRLNPLKRWLFSLSLSRAQKLAVNREEWKNQAVRQLCFTRRVLLTLGQRLHQQGALSEPDDIFFLEVDEVEPAATGRARFNVREVIQARRKEYQDNLTLSPPSGVVGKFNPSAPAAAALKPDPGTTVIEGIPVSPGVVTGPARVILHTEVQEQVLAGEILVAPFADPAWTPYFISAAGVVMDQGGVLSHGSIVARELGLPAVTNTISATRIIRSGDLIHVDGNCGRVTILNRGG